jgi:hypothetical protein
LLSRPASCSASPAVVPAEAAKRRFFRSKRGAAERVSLTVADCVYRSRTRSASTRAASECEWTVFRSLANTAVVRTVPVCVCCVAFAYECECDLRTNERLLLSRITHTTDHRCSTCCNYCDYAILQLILHPHSLPLPRPVPPLNRSSVSRVGRALTSETSDDGLGPMRATKFGEHFPTPADCLCGPASPRGAVKRRPRPVTASSTALCTGQALCQLRQQHSRSPPRRGPVYSPGTHG